MIVQGWPAASIHAAVLEYKARNAGDIQAILRWLADAFLVSKQWRMISIRNQQIAKLLVRYQHTFVPLSVKELGRSDVP